jgi:anti-sigma B factor antagonist
MAAGISGRYQRTAPEWVVRLDSSDPSGKLPPPVTEGNVSLTRRSRGPVEVVSLSGTLDAWSEPDVRTALLEVLREGRSRVVLDLAQLRRVDSSGLSALLSVLKAARSAGGDVVLLAPSASVVSVLRLTRLDQILEAFEDEAAALARLSA